MGGGAGPPGEEQPGKVFVGGIDPQMGERDIEGIFSKFGKISNVFLGRDRETGRPRGFCYIKFEDPVHADNCILDMDRQELNGNEIRVEHAYRGGQRDDGGGPRRGGFVPRGRGRGGYDSRPPYRSDRGDSPGGYRGVRDYQPRGRGRGRGGYSGGYDPDYDSGSSRGGYRGRGGGGYRGGRDGGDYSRARDDYGTTSRGSDYSARLDAGLRRRYSPSPPPAPRDYRDTRDFAGGSRSGAGYRVPVRSFDRDGFRPLPRDDYGAGRGYSDFPPRGSDPGYGSSAPSYGGRGYSPSPPPRAAPVRGPPRDDPYRAVGGYRDAPPMRPRRELSPRAPPRDVGPARPRDGGYPPKRSFDSARDYPPPRREFSGPPRDRQFRDVSPPPIKRHREDVGGRGGRMPPRR